MTTVLAEKILESYADPARLPASEPRRLAKLLALDEPTARSHVQLARQVSVGLRPGAESTLVWVLGRKHVHRAGDPRSNASPSSQGWPAAFEAGEREALRDLPCLRCRWPRIPWRCRGDQELSEQPASSAGGRDAARSGGNWLRGCRGCGRPGSTGRSRRSPVVAALPWHEPWKGRRPPIASATVKADTRSGVRKARGMSRPDGMRRGPR